VKASLSSRSSSSKSCHALGWRRDLGNGDQQNDWRVHYHAALLEADPLKMPERIQQAYNAVQSRLNAHQNIESAEYQALADALANLRVLQREIASTTDTPKTNRGTSSGFTPL
jgi:hypothetical protein